MRGAQRRSNPEHKPRTGLLRFARNDEIRFRSRGAMRVRGMPYNRMIPKSGYRFSDKIMRKRQSTTPLSTIASRLNRRWDRLSARSCSANTSPSLASLTRATKQRNKKEAERRQAHVFRWSASADAARATQTSVRSLRTQNPRSARLTAFHRGTCGREPTPPLSSRTRFLGRSVGGRYPPSPIPVQRQSRRPVIVPAGRFPVSRPGAEVTSPCPREPLLPHRPASLGRCPSMGNM